MGRCLVSEPTLRCEITRLLLEDNDWSFSSTSLCSGGFKSFSSFTFNKGPSLVMDSSRSKSDSSKHTLNGSSDRRQGSHIQSVSELKTASDTDVHLKWHQR